MINNNSEKINIIYKKLEKYINNSFLLGIVWYTDKKIDI